MDALTSAIPAPRGPVVTIRRAEPGAATFDRLIVADVLDKDGEDVAAAINKAGGKASYRHLDVTDEANWKKVV